MRKLALGLLFLLGCRDHVWRGIPPGETMSCGRVHSTSTVWSCVSSAGKAYTCVDDGMKYITCAPTGAK